MVSAKQLKLIRRHNLALAMPAASDQEIESYFAQFLHYMRRWSAVTTEEFEQIRKPFHYRFVPKGEIIWKEGGFCREMGFLAKGLTRHYFEDGHSREATRRLAPENNMMVAYGSYVFERPSEESVVAVEDCHVLFVARRDDMEMQSCISSYRLFRIRIVEQEFVAALRFLDGFLADEAVHRYRRLVKYSPGLFERVPLKHIASLIGVTPTQLSRIRSKMSETDQAQHM